MKKIVCEVVEMSNSPLPSGFLQQLPSTFEQAGEWVYRGRNQIKKMRVNGQTVCVKKYGVPPLVNRLLYSWGWRVPKAQNTYQNAQEILRRGFKTPQQYGYVLVRKNGIIGESFSVGEFVENAQDMAHNRQDLQLIRAFARFTADLHARGLMHRDYIASNIFCKKTGEDSYEFMLIDVNRFVFRNGPIDGVAQRANLMQPFHDYEELARFVRFYAAAARKSKFFCKQVLAFRWGRNRYSDIKRWLRQIPLLGRLSPKYRKG